MAIRECSMCQQDLEASRLYGREGFEEGSNCPICQRPNCRFHLTNVRWRWRDSGSVGTARVCQRCVSAYKHRGWDVANRDWIT